MSFEGTVAAMRDLLLIVTRDLVARLRGHCRLAARHLCHVARDTLSRPLTLSQGETTWLPTR